MSRIRKWMTRAHLRVGEALGLTRYRNCHGCSHCRQLEGLSPEIIGCDLYLADEDGQLAITDPSEAVWCDEFRDRKGGAAWASRSS